MSEFRKGLFKLRMSHTMKTVNYFVSVYFEAAYTSGCTV
jgi:hypothetical protein